jgi:molybdate transport system substrate-binding protein
MRRRFALAAAVVALSLVLAPATAAVSGITVFAAASLANVFPKIDDGPRYSFGGSDALALQIRNGAPVDVFASASPVQAEALYRDELVLRPRVFAANRLTVIVPRANPARIRTVFDLRRSGVKLVIGDPQVPIGAYTRVILARLGISKAVLRNVVSQENDVRGVLAKVALRQADAGFVYATDARTALDRVSTISIPARAQPNVSYEIAVTAESDHRAAAQAFVRRVLSPAGRTELRRNGFGVPKR